MTVSRSQRFTRGNLCPICGGFDNLRRGRGIRCMGFLSSDSKYAHCSREEQAGNLPLNSGTQTYAHYLAGECKCGKVHDSKQAVPRTTATRDRGKREIVATYDYPDETGDLRNQAVRFSPKGFSQRRPDGNGGWIWDLKGVRPVPYRLPEMLQAIQDKKPVFIVEGEKDVDRLLREGLPATTCPMGAGKWRDEYSPYFKDGLVIIIPDNDEEGRKHAEQVRESLTGVAKAVQIFSLPHLPEKGDISDWFDRGGTKETLGLLISEEAKKQKEKAVSSEEDGDSPEPGYRILDDLHAWLNEHVAYSSKHHSVAVALWAAHTHLLEKAASTPRLVFTSPEPECGKSRNLELLEPVSRNAKFVLQMSPASLFRWVEKAKPTILLDEVDTVFGRKAKDNHEDLRALVNSGHRPGASVPRVIPPSMEVKEFKTFCPVVLAGIGDLPDTIKSRSIIIPMRRRAPDEVIKAFRERITRPEGHKLRERLEIWTAQIADKVSEEPELPEGVTDRQADCWEPLIAIADAAGGNWPDLAREACKEIVKGRVDEVSQGIQLLLDIKNIFDRHGEPLLETQSIVEGLLAVDTSPWATWLEDKSDKARGVWLAGRLKPFGIKPGSHRFGEATKRGYAKSDFLEAWTRYLVAPIEGKGKDEQPQPEPRPEERNKHNKRNAPGSDVASVASVASYGLDTPSALHPSGESDSGGFQAELVTVLWVDKRVKT